MKGVSSPPTDNDMGTESNIKFATCENRSLNENNDVFLRNILLDVDNKFGNEDNLGLLNNDRNSLKGKI